MKIWSDPARWRWLKSPRSRERMYDFLCLFPHANASHSLIHYLNQHTKMHVAPYASLSRSLDDLLAYERNLRPALKTIGAATKDYHDPEIVKKFLDVTKRDIVVQTVRDPVESFVAQTNNSWFVRKFSELMGKGGARESVEELIADAVTRFITPAAAEKAFEVDSFKQHIIIDVEDLKGDKTQGAVETLWRTLCGDDNPAHRTTNHYKPIGARNFTKMREFGAFALNIAEGKRLTVHGMADGDLMNNYFDAKQNTYGARDVVLMKYPDAAQLVPSLRLTGPLRVCAYPYEWHLLHPRLREMLLPEVCRAFEIQMAVLNKIFAEAETAMDFSLESMTPVQKELLKVGIEDDFQTFMRRHPAAAERWTVTRTCLGL
jgi:hypothetical protein